jgi:hypothetical protein
MKPLLSPIFLNQKNNRTVRERFDSGLQMFHYTMIIGEGARMSGETSWPVEERRHPFPIECLNTCEANGKKGRAAGLCIGHALVVVGDLVHR